MQKKHSIMVMALLVVIAGISFGFFTVAPKQPTDARVVDVPDPGLDGVGGSLGLPPTALANYFTRIGLIVVQVNITWASLNGDFVTRFINATGHVVSFEGPTMGSIVGRITRSGGCFDSYCYVATGFAYYDGVRRAALINEGGQVYIYFYEARISGTTFG